MFGLLVIGLGVLLGKRPTALPTPAELENDPELLPLTRISWLCVSGFGLGFCPKAFAIFGVASDSKMHAAAAASEPV